MKFLEEEIEIGSKAIVMRSYRVIVPAVLQRSVVLLAHDGHQEISKTKELLRSKVWFVGIDSLVDEVIRVCHAFTLIYLN